MKREQALQILREIGERAAQLHLAPGPFWQEMQGVWVFGSVARGALTPGDVDVLVAGRADWLAPGVSMTSHAQALRGRRHKVTLALGHFDAATGWTWPLMGREQILKERCVVWSPEHPDVAANIAAIPCDAASGRAPRPFDVLGPNAHLLHVGWARRDATVPLVKAVNAGVIGVTSAEVAPQALWDPAVRLHATAVCQDLAPKGAAAARRAASYWWLTQQAGVRCVGVRNHWGWNAPEGPPPRTFKRLVEANFGVKAVGWCGKRFSSRPLMAKAVAVYGDIYASEVLDLARAGIVVGLVAPNGRQVTVYALATKV